MQWRPQEDLMLYSSEIWVESSRKIRFGQALEIKGNKGIPSDKEEHMQHSEGWTKRTSSGVSKPVCLTNIIQSEALYQQRIYWPPILGTYWLLILLRIDA